MVNQVMVAIVKFQIDDFNFEVKPYDQIVYYTKNGSSMFLSQQGCCNGCLSKSGSYQSS